MMAEIEIRTERVDDIPMLIGQQEKMGIPEVVDEVFQPHGHRQGLSLGWCITGWLSYILSQADHRMSQVEGWAAKREQTLQSLLPEGAQARDFTDDRLGDVLRYLSDDQKWAAVEEKLGQRLIRVYDLPTSRVRLDSTSVAVYHDPEGSDLFRYGHSKDHRPDLAQFKVMLGTLDPLGMPLATLVVPGQVADDGLYEPAIKRARAVLKRRGCLYIGDSKMEALATRAMLVAGGDFYLVPLSRKGKHGEWLTSLLAPVWEGAQSLAEVYLPLEPDIGTSSQVAQEPLAQGYETTRQQEAWVDDEVVSWQERVVVVYSPTLAEQGLKGLAGRLQRAEEKLRTLTPPKGRGKRKWTEGEPLQAAAEAILKKHRVHGLLHVTYREEVTERSVRRYKDRPARREKEVRYYLELHHDLAAIEAAQRSLGWRLYVTNASVERLSFSDVVLAYRGAPRIERNFLRLKGRPLGLRPLYVRREDHTCGMVRLLSLALRVLSVTEFVVRQQLHQHQAALPGLYAGNPTRTTSSPTTERLLAAFDDITLTVVQMPEQAIRHLTPLSALQQRILSLLGLPLSTYSQLTLPVEPIPP